MVAVLPGVWDTFARPLRLNSLFKSDDLPTFDRPENATSGAVEGVSCAEVPNDRSNRTLLKFIALSFRRGLHAGALGIAVGAGRCSMVPEPPRPGG